MTPAEARDMLTAQGCTYVRIEHVSWLTTYEPCEGAHWNVTGICGRMFDCYAETLDEAVAEALADIEAWNRERSDR